MKVYAEFYHLSTGYDNKPKVLIPGCGDRAIIRIDGRLNLSTTHGIAKQACGDRKYLAYQIMKGDSIMRLKQVSDLITL